MAKEKKKKVITKKEMSRVTRENRQMKYLTTGIIAVLVLVVGILVYGILNEYVLQGKKTVASVNGEKISLDEFQKQVRYQRYQYIRTYTSYAQIYYALGADMGSSFLSNLKSIESELSEENKVNFGQKVLDNMVENIAIAQYAEANGITVSQEEIDAALQEAFGFYAHGTPTPTSTVTPFVTSTLSATQYALVSPTPTRTVAPPTGTPTAAVGTEVPTDIPSSVPATEITGPLEAVGGTSTATATPYPTETPYTLQGYEKDLDSLLADMESIGFTKADLEQLFRYSLLRQKVYESLTANVPSVQEQVWARHILVADKATAEEVLQKLKAGNDWSTLVEEYSIDENSKYTGGDLGWFYRGKMASAFEEAAFKLAIGEVSEPVETENGWHIIQVLGHENRPMTVSDLNEAKNLIFNKWLDELTSQEGVKILDNWADDVPVTPTIPEDMMVQVNS